MGPLGTSGHGGDGLVAGLGVLELLSNIGDPMTVLASQREELHVNETTYWENINCE